jgi:hypothetical protein
MFIATLAFPLAPCCFTQPIRVNGGNQTMTISAGTAGGQPLSVLNTTCTLAYKKQSRISKITVSTSCPGQSFNLSVVATNVTKGNAAPQVALANGNPAMDLVTNIPATGSANATCTLQFTASATFSQSNSTEVGNDVHTITYTIQVQ